LATDPSYPPKVGNTSSCRPSPRLVSPLAHPIHSTQLYSVPITHFHIIKYDDEPRKVLDLNRHRRLKEQPCLANLGKRRDYPSDESRGQPIFASPEHSLPSALRRLATLLVPRPHHYSLLLDDLLLSVIQPSVIAPFPLPSNALTNADPSSLPKPHTANSPLGEWTPACHETKLLQRRAVQLQQRTDRNPTLLAVSIHQRHGQIVSVTSLLAAV
jgi:hypothetical protein